MKSKNLKSAKQNKKHNTKIANKTGFITENVSKCFKNENTESKLKVPSESRKRINDGDCNSVHKTCRNIVNGIRNYENIFPGNFHWIVFMVTLLIRIHYVSQKENWWVLHPDEIFQSLEVAHSEVYGYGFRPYEYMRPPDGANNNSIASNTQAYKLGMYSLRSFLFPTIFTIIAKIAVFLGWKKSPFIIWKIFHAFMTSCLPLSIYRFSKVLYRSHDIASMASIVVASSVYINVFGTHTFINSFLSPVFFYTVSEIMTIIMSKQFQNHEKQEYLTEITESCHEIEGLFDEVKQSTQDHVPENTFQYLVDHNRNYKNINSVSENGVHELQHSPQSDLIGKNDSSKFKNGHGNGFGCETCENSLNKSNSNRAQTNDDDFDDDSSTLRSCLFIKGLLFGISLYIRVDICLFLFFMFIPFISRIYRYFNNIILSLRIFIIGSITGAILCVYDDFICYGSWIISPWQWLNFNIIQNMSTKLFGTSSITFYIWDILFYDTAMVIFLNISFAGLVLFLLKNYMQSVNSLPWKHISINLNVLFTLSALLFVYSLQGHKERRFIHDTVVLLMVFYSSIIVYMCHILFQYCKSTLSKPIFWSILLIYISSQWNNFPSYKDKSNGDWTYGAIHDSNHVNICLDFISQQNDVTGVYIDMNFHVTGGYAILHKDVSIITFMHKEFYEFDTDSRLLSYKRQNFYGAKEMVSLQTLWKISDFISVRNTPYLLKVLINKSKYNYLILRTTRQFIKRGYKEVFRSGSMKVLKRIFEKEQEVYLRHIAASIPLGPNVLILNYEANWLLTYGLYDKAEEKLKYSLSIEETNLQTLQLLTQVYRHQMKADDVMTIYKVCKRHHSSNRCLQTPQRIVLHREYNFDLGL